MQNLCPTPGLLSHHFWGWGPGTCILISPPYDSDARQSLRPRIGVRARRGVSCDSLQPSMGYLLATWPRCSFLSSPPSLPWPAWGKGTGC